jgi:hypothetical protein
MKSRFASVATLATGALWVALALSARSSFGAIVQADIDSPDKRRLVVEMAEQLTRPPVVPPKIEVTESPFAPPGFDAPDPDEKAAARAALASSSQAGAKVAEALSDREILDKIGEKIVPSGTIFVGGKPMLMFGKKFVKVGTHFTVTFDGTDYELILTAVDRTTFSLRLNHEETTRPIQIGK